MKPLENTLRFFLIFSLVLFATDAQAQLLKKLGKSAERAAERTVERRVDREVSKKTDDAIDSILEPGSKPSSGPEVSTPAPPPPPAGSGGTTGNGSTGTQGNSPAGGPKSIQVYSKFDFVPGDKVIFFDDFSNDFIGDFPAKWNTNGSGQVVTLNDSPEKWFSPVPGYSTFYIPDVPDLPEEFTIEFDVMASGLDQKTASTAILRVELSDDKLFRSGNFASVDIPFCQYHPVGFHVRNSRGDINNNIQGDIRKEVLDRPHISIAVNKERFRLWVNEGKYVDIPRMISTETPPKAVKFEVLNFKDGKEQLFINNLKVAEGGEDLRRKLIAEGKVSTNGILFDSGSANLKPQSMGVIRQFYQVLEQEGSMRLRITGHTDSDGNDDTNMELSRKRAETVKNTLVSVYGIDGGRLEVEGKGETEPVADNNSPDGKAQNRRVEFIKI